MSKEITIITTGVRGGAPQDKTTGRAEITDHDEEFTISVDCYEGFGNSYKQRERTEICIEIGDNVFKGTVDELKKKLFS